MITINNSQKARFQALEDERIIQDIAAFLGRLHPGDGPAFTPEENLTTARESYHRGRELGLRWKDKLCLFAFLVRITDRAALSEPLVETAFTEPGADPHHVLTQMLEGMKILARAEV